MLGEVLAILEQPDEARRTLEKALARLSVMQPTVAAAFRHLTLDFLLAAAYLFATMYWDQLADHYLQLILKNAGRETDIGKRAQQLAIRLSRPVDLNRESLPADSLSDEASLAQLLSQFRF